MQSDPILAADIYCSVHNHSYEWYETVCLVIDCVDRSEQVASGCLACEMNQLTNKLGLPRLVD